MTILTPMYDDPSPLKEDNDDADKCDTLLSVSAIVCLNRGVLHILPSDLSSDVDMLMCDMI